MLKNATVEEIDAILSFIISCGSSENRSEQKAAVEALISVNGLLKKESLLNFHPWSAFQNDIEYQPIRRQP